ncbi:MAG: glycosyltransferase [Candidatus Helarchaeota archaeon]
MSSITNRPRIKFDVGICAYNEQKNIGKLLRSLLTEEFQNELNKIYVVCSGCTDNTEKIVRNFTNQSSNIVLIHEDERRGKPSALNKILSKALAPVFVYIAADNRPQRGSIDKIVWAFKAPKVGGVNGHPIPTAGFKFSKYFWELHHHYLKYEAETGKLEHLTGEFCAFRPIFKKMPLEILCDDSWIAMTLKRNNYKITYEQDAVSFFKGPVNIFEYIKQRSRNLWGHNQIKHRTLKDALFSEPYYVVKILLSTIRDIGFLNFLYLFSLELFAILKSKFYKKGNVWDKITC